MKKLITVYFVFLLLTTFSAQSISNSSLKTAKNTVLFSAVGIMPTPLISNALKYGLLLIDSSNDEVTLKREPLEVLESCTFAVIFFGRAY